MKLFIVRDCKFMNTFILDNGDRVNQICDPSKPHESSKLSTETFKIVECNIKSLKAIKPPCEYNGTTYKAKIKITCDGGRPSFFSESTEKIKV